MTTIHSLKKLSIKNFKTSGVVDIIGCTIDSINISDAKIKGNCSLSNSKVTSEVRISKLFTQNNFWIQGCEIGTSIKMYEANIEGQISFFDTKVLKETTIYQGKIGIIQLMSTNYKNNFRISDISFTTIKAIYGFQNLGYMQWNSLKPLENAKIEILNSIMGRWDIISCDFSKTALIIYSSKITDTFYTNTKFPEVLSVPVDLAKGENLHDVLRDGYNQLKTIAQKQNDRKTYLHFQAAELRSYYKSLHWWCNFRTKFQLGAMRISNNYGVSWGLGFLFVITANFIFVSMAYYYREPLFTGKGLGIYFSGYLSSLFSLINVPKYFETTWEVNWFYFSRLFIAFGIYQTIAAFRKFGKSE